MSATDRFIEEMGLISQESGDSRISGRIMGLLVASGTELSLNQISERLGVSRASVSTNARQLARRGVIKLTSHAGDRQDFYELSNIPYFDMLAELAAQFQRRARTIGACVTAMESEDRAAAARAANVQEFFENSADFLQKWAGMLRDDAASKDDSK